MKIIISPSKTQTKDIDKSIQKKPQLNLYTNELFVLMRGFNKEELGKVLSIKGKLLDSTYEEYQKDFNEKKSYSAIDLYEGVVFEQLEVYEDLEEKYLNQHLCILSAMYGVLEPESSVYPYRLDMKAKLNEINLYNFWQKVINEYFKEEKVIINLASKEFSDMLKNHKEKLITVEFYEMDKNGELKIASYNAKKMRGKMLNYLVKNQILNLDDIKKFNEESYAFSESLSTSRFFKFIKYS
jgi:cytoplasmic iron level regulating protein YaaA (DUF328/UPF0246 family)